MCDDIRPSGCVLHHDAHHTTIPLATATTLTARLASKESKPRDRRESKEREPDPRWGRTRSLGQVYYLCFTRSGAQRARPVAPGTSLKKRWRSLNSERKKSASSSQYFLTRLRDPDYYLIVAKILFSEHILPHVSILMPQRLKIIIKIHSNIK